ncbi:hypothetical protein BKA83DRAFT_4123377 [Pisolithus microcarpus]|nr:hypothetical protein BKA83DRAFT_4123377 [Pisolithus microcarpus]
MANSTIPELELDGKNWKVFQESLLEAAAMKGWLGILSGQEPSDETLQWEGRDARPSELSVEPPVKERLENGLTKVRSKDKAEAAVGAAQQLPPQSVEVEEYLPELQEQLTLRAVEPLKSEHMEVLIRKVKKLVKVEKPVEVKKPVKVEKLVEVEKPVEAEDVDRKAT